jgi:hypothetical protein
MSPEREKSFVNTENEQWTTNISARKQFYININSRNGTHITDDETKRSICVVN